MNMLYICLSGLYRYGHGFVYGFEGDHLELYINRPSRFGVATGLGCLSITRLGVYEDVLVG